MSYYQQGLFALKLFLQQTNGPYHDQEHVRIDKTQASGEFVNHERNVRN